MQFSGFLKNNHEAICKFSCNFSILGGFKQGKQSQQDIGDYFTDRSHILVELPQVKNNASIGQ